MESVGIGYSTMFDVNRGGVYIVGGEACWDEMINTLSMANAFVDEQVARLAEQGVNLEDMGIPYESITQVIDVVSTYTDGTLLVSGWAWRHSDLSPGDSVGVCFAQDGGMEEAAGTCWAYTLTTSGEYKDMAESYLIKPSEITADSRLSDFTDISNDMIPGLFGSWMCLPAMSDGEMAFTSCLRFMPSAEGATVDDPRFNVGPVTVMTYNTARYNTVEFQDNAAMQLEESNFEFFSLNLMGAQSGVAFAGVALAASLAAMTF